MYASRTSWTPGKLAQRVHDVGRALHERGREEVLPADHGHDRLTVGRELVQALLRRAPTAARVAPRISVRSKTPAPKTPPASATTAQTPRITNRQRAPATPQPFEHREIVDGVPRPLRLARPAPLRRRQRNANVIASRVTPPGTRSPCLRARARGQLADPHLEPARLAALTAPTLRPRLRSPGKLRSVPSLRPIRRRARALADAGLELGDPRPQLVDVAIETRRGLAVARSPQGPPVRVLGQPEIDGQRSQASGSVVPAGSGLARRFARGLGARGFASRRASRLWSVLALPKPRVGLVAQPEVAQRTSQRTTGSIVGQHTEAIPAGTRLATSAAQFVPFLRDGPNTGLRQ